MRRRVVALAATILAMAFASAIGAPAAFAHASVVTTEPADGAVVTTSPNEVTITFSEAVSRDPVDLTIAAAGGDDVTTGIPTLDPTHRVLSATIPVLPNGAYRVHYSVRDPVDLHRTAGSIVFGVGVGTAVSAAGTADNAPDATEVTLRWLERLAAFAIVGALVLLLVVLPRSSVDDPTRTANWLLEVTMASAALLVVLDVVQLARDLGSIHARLADLRRELLYSEFGRREFVIGQAAIGVYFAARLLRGSLRRSWIERWRDGRYDVPSLGPVVLASIMLAAMAWTAHATTGGRFVFGYLLRLGHLTALGVWVGGLVVLALAWLLPRAPRPAQLIASFSPVAAAAMGVIVTTGLAMSAREVSTVTALLGTWFGKALLAKLVVLALALVLAVVQRKRLRSGRTSSVPAAIEAVLAIAIVVGGVAMSASAPAQGIRFTGPNSPAPPSQRSTVLEGLTVQIGIQPNRPGANDLTVLVLDPRRPSPTPVAGATVSLASTNGTNESRQSSVAANKTTDLGQVQIGGAGQLNVMVTVTRQGAAPLVTAVPWTVGSYVPPRAKTIVSDARLGSWLALAATLVGAVSLGLLVRGRRRPGRPPTAPPDGPPEADQTETDLPIALQDASAGPITLD